MGPADDPTSLGNILIDMGLLTKEELISILQERASFEVLMGKLMIAKGIITESQLEKALSIQLGLRSASRYDQAMAAAKMAIHTNNKVAELASALYAKSKGTNGPQR